MPVGPHSLWPEKRIKVAIEILHVDLHVRCRLRAVDQHRHAARVRERDHVLDRIDGAERVRHMHHADESGAFVEQASLYSSIKSSPASLIGT